MNNNWIEWKWTPEKPYPETLDTWVSVKFYDGLEVEKSKVKVWYSDNKNSSLWEPYEPHSDDITHYKLA